MPVDLTEASTTEGPEPGAAPGHSNPVHHRQAIDLIEAARLGVQRALRLDDSGGSENSESSESSESSENSESSESSEGKEACESVMFRAMLLADPSPNEWGDLLTSIEQASREMTRGQT